MKELAPSALEALRVLAARGDTSIADLSPREARLQYQAGAPSDQLPFQTVESVEDRWCGTTRIRIWRGLGASHDNAPAMLYLHGGGWVIGSIETHEDICRRIANFAGAVVVSPDYRLAPEAPFPAGLNDCADVLRYVHDHAHILRIDRDRVAVGGDSAGGNLAAALALMTRQGTAPAIAAQVLFYPNTEQHQSSNSFREYAEGFGLTAREMAWFRDHYLPNKAHWGDPLAAPLRANALDGLPPAVIVLAGQDILFSEGHHYAERLQAENYADICVWPGQIHGFISMTSLIPEATEALRWACKKWMELS